MKSFKLHAILTYLLYLKLFCPKIITDTVTSYIIAESMLTAVSSVCSLSLTECSAVFDFRKCMGPHPHSRYIRYSTRAHCTC